MACSHEFKTYLFPFSVILPSAAFEIKSKLFIVQSINYIQPIVPKLDTHNSTLVSRTTSKLNLTQITLLKENINGTPTARCENNSQKHSSPPQQRASLSALPNNNNPTCS